MKRMALGFFAVVFSGVASLGMLYIGLVLLVRLGLVNRILFP